MRHGFSLVELSIVLVILGLLTGGILAGQSLIRASELRAVSAEQARFRTAALTFRDKYFALPGDFRDATRFWGRSRNTSDCVTNSSAAVATPGVCDGDGDGLIELPVTPWNPDTAGETFQFWRQLQLAGMMEGNITGFTPPLGGPTNNNPSYSPPSKLSGMYWSALSDLTWFGAANYPPGTDGANMLTTTSETYGTFDPSEMWNIDTKLDDGIPTSGNVVSVIQGWGGPTACVYGLSFPNGFYKLDHKEKNCRFVLRRPF